MKNLFEELADCYQAPLVSARPQDGMGFFDRKTGVCRYYSDGRSEWFFEMGSSLHSA